MEDVLDLYAEPADPSMVQTPDEAASECDGGEATTMTDQLPEVPGGPHLRTIAMPADANAGGSVFGGWTLSQMDLARGSFAAERAGGRVATVAIEAMRFLRPVAVGTVQ